MASGSLTAEALARACLDESASGTPCHAFAHLDPERALAEAELRSRAEIECSNALTGSHLA
jgi:hypothetical protein